MSLPSLSEYFGGALAQKVLTSNNTAWSQYNQIGLLGNTFTQQQNYGLLQQQAISSPYNSPANLWAKTYTLDYMKPAEKASPGIPEHERCSCHYGMASKFHKFVDVLRWEIDCWHGNALEFAPAK